MSGTAQPTADGAALEQLGINVIRGLAMDAPEKAHSGHTGTAMALAPLAHVLWTRVMRHDPTDPTGPGPLRALQRARVDPPLLHALPHRLRPHARRPPGVPPVGQPDARAPRAPAHRRRRGDDRAPRTG